MPKKSTVLKWAPLLVLWLAIGVYGSMKLRAEIGHPNDGHDSCIDVLLTGSDQQQQVALFQYLSEEFAGDGIASTEIHASNVPLFRTSLVKLSFSERYPKEAASIASKIEGRFPELRAAISYSTLAQGD